MHCRNCFSSNLKSFVNLYNQPYSNSFLGKEQVNKAENHYPLEAFFVQIAILFK